ncbi:hypothetical protein [Actinoplanes utahensis]|uniref:Uncharacterized protein n=1 Tax=Actinoplanes utahensis TaxID=1869 RepID=A0A0A6UDU5_ACTUT|nr:hypothetical protein [Actinoplanes utahensis]KHD74205.1 hypothetical protein MB27_30120 [Actinoplanes utahensis]GIF31150.1 hypothetical protein Aut01nite_41360 [Actinoplanes utahensis]
MNDEQADRLLRPLRHEPEAPAGYDVSRAMAEGRRRRSLRRWSSGAALIAVTSVTAGGGTFAVAALRDEKPIPAPTTTTSVAPSVVAAAPDFPRDCTVVRLPTDGVKKALVTSGDPEGRYLAGRLYGTSVTTIIWKDGKILARPEMDGGDASFDDINRAGIAVGSAYVGDERQQAYAYADGKVTALDGEHTAASAINDAGVIAGAIGPTLSEAPARWDSVTAAVERLPLPQGITVGRARAIGEDGTIAGTVAKDSSKTESGYLWAPDGTGKAMPLPTAKGKKADYFWPTSISGGWVLGRAVFDTEQTRDFAALRYHLATGRYEELKTYMGYDMLLAENGWIAGTMEQPMILAGSRKVALPRYGRLRDYHVSSFSADGRVVGGYTSDSGSDGVGNEPLLWTCR